MVKKRIKKILLDKRSGNSVYVGLAVSIVILTIFIVLMGFSYMVWMLSMNTSDDVDMVLTTYCKRMETQGYLSTNEVESLKEELEQYGFINVTVSGAGTDGIKQSYGNDIRIEVRGNIDYVNDEKFSSIKETIINMRTILNNPDIGVYKNRDMIKASTCKG